ncbi:MAG: hypothetical protein ACPGLV_11615 [Bacteroidia bacterium]
MKFIFADKHGKTYFKFPDSLCGQYQSEMGWSLKIEENKLDFFNLNANLEIEDELSKSFQLKKYDGFYVLERIESNLSVISILKPDLLGNLVVYFMPQDHDLNTIDNIIWEDFDIQENVQIIKANEQVLNSLIVKGFFSEKMTLKKVA